MDIGNKIGRCIEIEANVETTKRSFLRMKMEIYVNTPLMVRFWWTNSQGQEKCATIKSKRLFDFFYGCGTLGDITQTCKEEVKMSETKTTSPRVWTMVGGNETETHSN